MSEPITIKDVQEYVMWLRHGSPMTPRDISKLDIALFAIAQHAEIERMRPVVEAAKKLDEQDRLGDEQDRDGNELMPAMHGVIYAHMVYKKAKP